MKYYYLLNSSGCVVQNFEKDYVEQQLNSRFQRPFLVIGPLAHSCH